MDKIELGVCLIGCGRAGMIHAGNFKGKVLDAHMVACVDTISDIARAAAEELGIDNWYTDYRDAIKDPRIDCVIVVSPSNLHKDIVCDCANAKKHIFCEKPMAMNTTECEAMIEACDRNDVKLQIGFMRRFDKSYIKAKELLTAGAIGDLVLIRSNTRGPSKPQPWTYDLNHSNGILAEVNSHDIDCVRWFAGSEIKRLYAIGGNFRNLEVKSEYPDYYDNVIMNGVFENGVQFSIDGAVYVQYGYDAHVELVGTKGVLHVGRNDENFIRCVTVEHGGFTPFINSWRSLFAEAYLAEDISFIRCIQENLTPVASGKDGLMAVRIVEAGNRSIKTNSIVNP